MSPIVDGIENGEISMMSAGSTVLGLSSTIYSQKLFNLPATISYKKILPTNSYNFFIGCSGLSTFNIQYHVHQKLSITLSTSWSKSDIISYHENIDLSSFSNTQNILIFMEPRNNPQQKTTSLHIFVNNHEFILSSIPFISPLCKTPEKTKQIKEPIDIQQITPPQSLQNIVQFLTKYEEKLLSENQYFQSLNGIKIKVSFLTKYQQQMLWKLDYFRLRLKLLFQDIGYLVSVSKYRFTIHLYKVYDFDSLNEIKTEIQIRSTKFMWQICQEIQLGISKDNVIKSVIFLNQTINTTHLRPTSTNSSTSSNPEPRLIELLFNNDDNNIANAVDNEFGSGFHAPTPLLNASILDLLPFSVIRKNHDLNNMDHDNDVDNNNNNNDESKMSFIQNLNDSPRILFLVAIICGGMILITVIAITSILYYFCCKYKENKDYKSEKRNEEINFQMRQISKSQFEKFEPVLQELKDYDFEVCFLINFVY